MSNLFPDLAKALHDYAQQHARLNLLDDTTVERITEVVAQAFVKDRESLWWWDSIHAPVMCVAYGEEDGLDRVQGILSRFVGPFTLVITDDEWPPWEGVKGSLDALIEMLREHRSFEYFVVDDSLTWVLFDTHHNSLVIAGDLARSSP